MSTISEVCVSRDVPPGPSIARAISPIVVAVELELTITVRRSMPAPSHATRPIPDC